MALAESSKGVTVLGILHCTETSMLISLSMQDACQIGGPHLEYDDYAKAKIALDSAKAAMSTLSEENRILAERLGAAEKEKKQLMERLRVSN